MKGDAMVKKHTLLIVDDNEELLQTLIDYFSSKGYDVSSAVNGLDAIKIIDNAEVAFDCVVTDLVMPNVSGIGLIAIIKKKYPETPVIAITGWGVHPEKLAAEANANLVLEKPFELPVLGQHIQALIAAE